MAEKTDGLFLKYFVLNPNKASAYGHASRMAMLTYAAVIDETNKQLAQDLRRWVWGMQAALAAVPSSASKAKE